MKNKKDFILVLLIIFLGIYYRLIPHEPNFSPLIAITVFSGFILTQKINRFLAFLIPLIILFSSDIFLGFYSSFIFVYLAFLISTISSFVYYELMKSSDFLKKDWANIINSNISSLINNFIFFIISNFGVWLTGKMYPKSWQGLIECYIMAIPFLKNSIISSIIFTTLISIIYHSIERKIPITKDI